MLLRCFMRTSWTHTMKPRGLLYLLLCYCTSTTAETGLNSTYSRKGAKLHQAEYGGFHPREPAALQRAALDGLSTKRRLRTAVLPIDESGEEQTVNVKRLGRAQRAQLVSKVTTARQPVL